ncbi:Hypothetical protein HVR_LOCUS680 [uncultured virus]|nr:Hypothetical protein HVR_LOCUS680 [uncultured virus]
MLEQSSNIDTLCVPMKHLTLNVQRTQPSIILSILPSPTNNSSRRISKFTLSTFVERAREIHGGKFDYSVIKETDIKNKHSTVIIICTDCGFEDEVPIRSHIYSKSGCKSCNNVIPWSYEKFLQKGFETHGNKFIYDKVTPEHIMNGMSRVPVICNDCGYEYNPTIHGHVNGKHSCPSCNNKLPWTHERFIVRAHEIHGEKFNYDDVLPEHIKGVNSEISLACNDCDYHWKTKLHLHINGRCNCPSCAGNALWTYERFILKAREMHEDKFNYDKVTPNHIKGCRSRVPIMCNDCGYEWSPELIGHIRGYDCPCCMGVAPWTLDRFIKAARLIHGDAFNYDNVKPGDITGVYSEISIVCNKCHNAINRTLSTHIHGYGCPHCVPHGYSKAQVQWLEDIMKQENIIIQYALSPQGEYSIPTVGKVDGYFPQTNTVYEFHGDFWHGNPKRFSSNDINPVSGKTYGELYQRTLNRDQRIRDLGYNLIIKWETH